MTSESEMKAAVLQMMHDYGYYEPNTVRVSALAQFVLPAEPVSKTASVVRDLAADPDVPMMNVPGSASQAVMLLHGTDERVEQLIEEYRGG